MAKKIWKERYRIPAEKVDFEWAGMATHNKNEWIEEARAILAAADGEVPR